jgi:hypothetical protein
MTDTAGTSDMGFGLGLAMTVLAIVAAFAMGGAGFVDALESISGGGHGEGLQVVAGLALTVSLLAGSIAIVAMHAYAE